MKPTLSQQLFELRGNLPPSVFTSIEIAGVVLLLLLWQIIANVGSNVNMSWEAAELKPYFSTTATVGGVGELDKARILLYDRAAMNPDELRPVLSSCAQNNLPLLLVTTDANARLVQSLASAGLNLVAVQALGNKTASYQKIADFSGATIVDDAFFAEDSTAQLNENLLGQVDRVTSKVEGIELQIHKEFISNALLPSPIEVLKAFKPLFQRDNLLGNTAYSLYLNLSGYLLALLIAIPLGFVIGLFPLFNALFRRNIDAMRFVPLTAVTGLFIAWFGIETQMKIAFLAFGIIVYLLPVVVQRISEVESIYTQTAYTLGASKWQQIRTVFMPAVFAKISDDIRVLVAISWTYIIVAELVNANSGGIGALAFKSARQSSIDKVFAILLVIIFIGFIQDKMFILLDRILFPYKHQVK